MPLRRYADFSGRSRRKEYWMFTLGILIVFTIVSAVVGGIAGALGGATNSSNGVAGLGLAGMGILGLMGLAIIIPSLAVQVRRLHDQDRTGWWILIGFIPYLGGLVMLVFMCLPGTRGPNSYGPDPKQENLADVFS